MINPSLLAFTVPIDRLRPDPENPRGHDERNIAVIMESLSRYGQQTPIVHENHTVIKGNGTLEAARRLGWKEIAAIPFDMKDKLPKHVTGYKLVDNRSGELSFWQTEPLREDLQTLINENDNVEKLGWDEDEIEQLLNPDVELPSDATLLEKAGFMSEPKTILKKGDTRNLGKHFLIVADPVKDVPLWRPHLLEDDYFCPFAGPYIAMALAGDKRRLLIVQPDPFVAGHIVDKWQEQQGT